MPISRHSLLAISLKSAKKESHCRAVRKLGLQLQGEFLHSFLLTRSFLLLFLRGALSQSSFFIAFVNFLYVFTFPSGSLMFAALLRSLFLGLCIFILTLISSFLTIHFLLLIYLLELTSSFTALCRNLTPLIRSPTLRDPTRRLHLLLQPLPLFLLLAPQTLFPLLPPLPPPLLLVPPLPPLVVLSFPHRHPPPHRPHMVFFTTKLV